MLLYLLGLLSIASKVALVAAEDVLTVVDFNTAVQYQPQSAWRMVEDGGCNGPDHFTTTIGANATLQFVGNKIVVEGMLNNASGVLEVQMDGGEPFTADLYAQNVSCGVFFEYDVGNGTHTVVMTLFGASPSLFDPVKTLQPVMHLTSIIFWTPQTDDSTIAATSIHHKDVGAIVGAVVCSIVGALLIVGAIFWFIRQRKRRAPSSRHAYDPNTLYITELPQRSPPPTASDAKFQPYARMEDDGDMKISHLTVPPPSRSISTGRTGGLRSRSRSPLPDRKNSL